MAKAPYIEEGRLRRLLKIAAVSAKSPAENKTVPQGARRGRQPKLFIKEHKMSSVKPLDLRKDSDTNPEISQLLRVILHADPLAVAEGVNDGVPHVIVSGANKHFTFTKTADGYTLKASDFKG